MLPCKVFHFAWYSSLDAISGAQRKCWHISRCGVIGNTGYWILVDAYLEKAGTHALFSTYYGVGYISLLL
jgi:hypothetical protein